MPPGDDIYPVRTFKPPGQGPAIALDEVVVNVQGPHHGRPVGLVIQTGCFGVLPGGNHHLDEFLLSKHLKGFAEIGPEPLGFLPGNVRPQPRIGKQVNDDVNRLEDLEITIREFQASRGSLADILLEVAARILPGNGNPAALGDLETAPVQDALVLILAPELDQDNVPGLNLKGFDDFGKKGFKNHF